MSSVCIPFAGAVLMAVAMLGGCSGPGVEDPDQTVVEEWNFVPGEDGSGVEVTHRQAPELMRNGASGPQPGGANQTYPQQISRLRPLIPNRT